MDDLISRKAVYDGLRKYGFLSPDMTVREFVEDELSSIPAVPLEPLCEWLAEYTGIGPCFNTSEHCKRTDFPCSIGHKWLDDTCLGTDIVKCWEALLKKWMEGHHEQDQ